MSGAKRQEWNVECRAANWPLGVSRGGVRSTLEARRHGLTLVELLITITIIAILAGLVLGVATVAGETARERQTQHMIERLHTLLLEHYDTYKTRRVRLNPAVEAAIDGLPNASSAVKGRLRAEARLYALRELMVMEIPDRWSDILLTGVPASNAGNVTPVSPRYLDLSGAIDSHGRTPLASVFLRRYFQIAQNATSAAQVAALLENQGAECLYLIITIACGEGEARAMFGERSIGDTDGDGAMEFLDGWGRPIHFLRWAPGFDSQIQINANQLGVPDAGNSAWIAAASNDHDPFDMFRVDQFAFRLVPLIFSAGRDETLGVRLVARHVTWVPSQTPPAGLMLPGYPRLSAYWKVNDVDGAVYLGTTSEGFADNIHNHLLGLR